MCLGLGYRNQVSQVVVIFHQNSPDKTGVLESQFDPHYTTYPFIHSFRASPRAYLKAHRMTTDRTKGCPYVRRQPTSGDGYMIGGGVGFLAIVNLNRGSCSGKSFSSPQFLQVAW